MHFTQLRSIQGVLWCTTSLLLWNCAGTGGPGSKTSEESADTVEREQTMTTFGNQLEFLRRYVNVVLLERGPAQVAIVPSWQGRVMTSTSSGPGGPGMGWINTELIDSGEVLPHMNPYGGEDRIWLGPEGGQYSIFFPPGAPFVFDHWQVPAFLDTEAFDVVRSDAEEACFHRRVRFENYSGTQFDVDIDRCVRLLRPEEAVEAAGISWEGLQAVAFESVNRITNRGSEAWTADKGLLSIWILGMFPPSPRTTVIIPYRLPPGAPDKPRVNDRYFGKVPEDRLIVGPSCLFFRADGGYRSKIGLGWEYATPVIGSWDAEREVLTVVEYTLPDTPKPYVNSMWELQEDPYAGDVINAYNDGSPAPGQPPLGPFYELETSSPAAQLAPGESLEHRHRTFHAAGNRKDLEELVRQLLGVELREAPWQ